MEVSGAVSPAARGGLTGDGTDGGMVSDARQAMTHQY